MEEWVCILFCVKYLGEAKEERILGFYNERERGE
jgi:hypothetical protein